MSHKDFYLGLADQPLVYSHQALDSLRTLPSLKLSEISDEDSCAICLLPLDDLIKEGETAVLKAADCDVPGSSTEGMTGVVKLSVCGHVFCRKE